MKNFILKLRFALYMIGSIFKKSKLESLKKKGDVKGAEEYLYKVVKAWSKFIVINLGIKLEVEGLENIPEGPCLFTCNHQGILDIPVIVHAIPRVTGFVAKKELENTPIVSYWMKEIKCVFIDRTNPREGIKAIIEGSEYLKGGHPMLIFPEGTRSKGHEMGEFKKGSLKMALKAGVPIVPMTIEGTYKTYEGNNKKLAPAQVKLIIQKPVDTNSLQRDEKENIHVQIHDIIKEKL